MNAGLTMERVYDTLKQRLLRGVHRPGERLDPARLAAELNASPTPVRDALNRLVGERLVETWPQEGFHAPIPTEAGLRDLYRWNHDLLVLVLRAVGVPRMASSDMAIAANRMLAPARLFLRITAGSSNGEHRHAVAHTNDRLHLARLAEARALDGTETELADMESAFDGDSPAALRRLVSVYHRRRVRLVADIVAVMRDGLAIDSGQTDPQ